MDYDEAKYEISRLTNLHENDLGHILSHLPIKEAVRTSILSKDWRYKWTNSYNVDIDDCHNDEPQSFVEFMNTRLSFLRYIRKFRLECDLDDSNHAQTWIDNALTHKLESLDLQLREVEEIILPGSLLNSICLRELKLDFYGVTLNVAMNCFAPNLTSLFLYGVDILNNHSTSTTLKLSFPSLKTFGASQHSWKNVTYVEIDAPSLITLYSEPFKDDCRYLLVILSPRITEFACTIRLCEEIVVNGSSIVDASLFVGDETGDSELLNIGLRFRKVVNVFTNLRTLCLSGSSHQVSVLVYYVPRHDMLRELHLSGFINAELVLILLHKTPSLNVLRLSVGGWVDFDYGAIDSVPSCFVSHLEVVCISDFKCETSHYNMLNFLLKNGKKLKKLIMVSTPPDKQNEVEEYVSMFGISDLVLKFQSYVYVESG